MNNYYNYGDYLKPADQKMNPISQDLKFQQNMNMINHNPINSSQGMLENPMNNRTYEPYEGFIRGTMFPELYKPYKVRNPYEIKPMNEQADMLTYIDSLGFAMIDLTLYLDLHPDDKKMIEKYNQYRKQKEDIVRQYESKFGPLVMTSDALNNYPWMWDNKPWPWEGK